MHANTTGQLELGRIFAEAYLDMSKSFEQSIFNNQKGTYEKDTLPCCFKRPLLTLRLLSKAFYNGEGNFQNEI